MAFMEQQVTRKLRWLQVDTRNEGIVSYPADDFTVEYIADMHDVEPEDVQVIEGYGARLSAPGYLDCTEWTVFDTAEQAQSYLDEYYPEDEDEQDENE